MKAHKHHCLALGALALASALFITTQAKGQDDLEHAKVLFDVGAKAYGNGNFLAAIQAFEQAQKKAPRPAILFSLAQEGHFGQVSRARCSWKARFRQTAPFDSSTLHKAYSRTFAEGPKRLDGDISQRYDFIMRFSMLIAIMLAACVGDDKKSQVTERPCADPRQCSEQAPLCENSCDVPGAATTCRQCCAEQLKICENCEGFYSFNTCR